MACATELGWAAAVQAPDEALARRVAERMQPLPVSRAPGESEVQLERHRDQIRAWLAPHARGNQVRVTVPREAVERELLALQNPVPGSFSDFVWVFDPFTGDVVSAELTGRLVKRIDWGLFETEVEAEIRVVMATGSAVAFHKPLRWLGQELFRSCSLPAPRGCTVVEPAGYDAMTGYVNAAPTALPMGTVPYFMP